MELRQLRHFVALADLASFTAAASREHIVQSGLSNSVQALERDVNAELYIRGSRPVRLTPAGQALVDPARRALAVAQHAFDAVQEVQQVMTGQLRLGVVRSVQRFVRFPDYVAEFAACHPAVDISVLQLPVRVMLRLIGSGELDCAIVTAMPAALPGVRLTPLATERLVLLCRADHRLAQTRDVRANDLAGERFIDVQPEWSARAMVDAAFAAAGATRKVSCEVNEWELLLALVRSGAGIGFIPEGLTPEDPGLRTVTVKNLKLERQIQLALPQAGDMTPAARRFIEYVHRHHPEKPG
ncbi:MAG: LysR family transcriptional regulator [Mycobacterium sp.]